MPTKPLEIHRHLIEVLKKCPEGLTCGQARHQLEQQGLLSAEEQTHLDRRWRQLPSWYKIQKIRATEVVGGRNLPVVRYRYLGERTHIADEGQVSEKLRAAVLHAAHGRCEMCGRGIVEHGVVFQVDHKLPRDWGGTNDRENLWALCQECNRGKKAFFSSVQADSKMMKSVMAHDSVHVRIGELLKAFGVGVATPAYLIEIVSGENQEDWKKRLRELRYPVIGWDIRPARHTEPSGKVRADYVLLRWKPWPRDPTGLIRRFEEERRRKNRQQSG